MGGGNIFSGQRAVHIGPGAFSLGHIVPFFDQIGLDVQAISLRSDTTKNRLMNSGFDYTLIARDSQDFFETSQITALKGVTVVPCKTTNSPDAIREKQRNKALDFIANPDTSIVTMTVTVDGYGYSHNPNIRTICPTTGKILSGKTVAKEIPPINNPRAVNEAETTIAFLAAGLNRRRCIDGGPLVVMSLDNMPLNGIHLSRAVRDHALNNYGPELACWIRDNTFFPDTMVDRIVPKQDKERIEKFLEGSGLKDTPESPMIVTEKLPIRALVISTPQQAALEMDRDVNPAFLDHPVITALTELDGIEQSDMTNLFSERKVHVFNGAHFGMALVGRLAGHQYAHEAIADPAVRDFVVRLLDELSAGVPSQLADDAAHFTQEFIDRISNPCMMDGLERIGRNGSSKLYERVLIPWHIATTNSAGPSEHEAIDTVAAAWIEYLATTSRAEVEGVQFEIFDDNATQLGLIGLEPETYSDAHLIFGRPGVMEAFPGREVFGADVNAAKDKLYEILFNADAELIIGGKRQCTSVAPNGADLFIDRNFPHLVRWDEPPALMLDRGVR